MRGVALLFCFTALLSAQRGPVNLNFQDNGLGEKPTGWVSSSNPNYSIATVADCPTADSHCALVRQEGKTMPRGPLYFMQSFDATALRGKQVRYSAALRVDYPGLCRPQLFLRVDRPSGSGLSDYTYNQPLRSTGWETREIIGKIDDDAVRVTIGMMFDGPAYAYFADPEFVTIETQP